MSEPRQILLPQLGANIRAAREHANLTRAELAAKVGLADSGTVKTWESGRSAPTRPRLVKLCEALDRTAAWFYAEHPTDERQAA